ncbi:desmoglein-2-like isoform X2 [Phyllobates terribilis]|uniref:desmoglein-2-like isoform X2 n=1 Tax=Phyllobates terribilis TaxID=111132 RepID=UPI003CCA7769
MERSPAGGGICLLLLMVILDFGHGLHLEMVKRSRKPGDGAVGLVRHKREWIIPPVSIYEEQDNSLKNPIAKIQSDVKLDISRRIRYSITGPGVTEPPLGMFIINENTGEVNVTGIVDREQISLFFLKGYARDQNNVDVEPPIDLRVKVLDINDNDPVFTQDIFVASVEELSPANTLIMILNATDADEPDTINSKLAYRILSQNPGSSEFWVTKNGQVLTTVGSLDRETQSTYTLVVEVRDLDGDLRNGKSETATVKIKVKDVNDHIPVLEKEQYEGDVEENVANVEILRMKAFDEDEEFTDNWIAAFTIVSGNEDNYFEIVTDPQTNEGVLMLVKEADYEVMQSVELNVVVANRAEYHSSIKHLVVAGGGGAAGGAGGGAGGAAGGGGGGGGKGVPIKVNVKNVREGPVFKPRKKVLSIAEGKTIINKIVGSYQAYDADTGKVADKVKYAKEFDPDNWFMIDPTTADIKLIKVPDRESVYVVNGTYIAKILAISEDIPGKTATGTIAIEVEDVNDNCPILINPEQTVCNDAPFINLTATDPDGFPNGAPLKFMVVDEPPGNVKLWSIGKTDAVSAQLIPKNLYVGPHQVKVIITDNQGLSCPEKQVLTLTVCTCSDAGFACSERRTDTSVGLGGGAIALMILACLLLLLPLLLLLCSCGSSGGKGFMAVDGPEQSMLIHNKEGPEPVDTAVLPAMIGVVGSTAVGAGVGAGMREAYGVQSLEGYTKEIYQSSMAMDGHYEDNQALMNGEMMGAGGGMRMISGYGSAAGVGAGYGYGAGSQAALNEEFIKGYFYDKVLGCADEDFAQAAKDSILIYSQEGTGSISGSVGCCSLIESEFEENYLDDLGMKFKVLADICQGVEISQYDSYEVHNQGAIESEVITDIHAVQNEETVEHHQAMDNSYASSEALVSRLEPESVARENVVIEESRVSSRYGQDPVMRGNMLVTEKSYTTAPTIILQPMRQQNVLVTERIIRPATSIHNLVDTSEGENVMVTERVIKSDKGFSGYMTEPHDSQYMLVTERLLAPSSNLNASLTIPDVSMGHTIPDVSMGQNVVVTERHYTPITAINGSAMIPVEVSGGKNLANESISILNGGVQGQTHFKQGGYMIEETHPVGNNVEKSSSRMTKYSTVQYSRS